MGAVGESFAVDFHHRQPGLNSQCRKNLGNRIKARKGRQLGAGRAAGAGHVTTLIVKLAARLRQFGKTCKDGYGNRVTPQQRQTGSVANLSTLPPGVTQYQRALDARQIGTQLQHFQPGRFRQRSNSFCLSGPQFQYGDTVGF